MLKHSERGEEPPGAAHRHARSGRSAW